MSGHRMQQRKKEKMNWSGEKGAGEPSIWDLFVVPGWWSELIHICLSCWKDKVLWSMPRPASHVAQWVRGNMWGCCDTAISKNQVRITRRLLSSKSSRTPEWCVCLCRSRFSVNLVPYTVCLPCVYYGWSLCCWWCNRLRQNAVDTVAGSWYRVSFSLHSGSRPQDEKYTQRWTALPLECRRYPQGRAQWFRGCSWWVWVCPRWRLALTIHKVPLLSSSYLRCLELPKDLCLLSLQPRLPVSHSIMVILSATSEDEGCSLSCDRCMFDNRLPALVYVPQWVLDCSAPNVTAPSSLSGFSLKNVNMESIRCIDAELNMMDVSHVLDIPVIFREYVTMHSGRCSW